MNPDAPSSITEDGIQPLRETRGLIVTDSDPEEREGERQRAEIREKRRRETEAAETEVCERVRVESITSSRNRCCPRS
ncbi:hypothetical protein MHYP_G00306310 [Metynnis hypsauchen]